MIIPKELQFTAERLMKTPQRVGTADNESTQSLLWEWYQKGTQLTIS